MSVSRDKAVRRDTLTRTRARDVDRYVVEISRLMLDDKWITGVTNVEIAEREGVQPGTVDEWASDAARLIRIGPDVDLYRARNLRRLDRAWETAMSRQGYTMAGEAYENPDVKAATGAVAEQNKMLGLHAPQKHEVAMVVAQYEQMAPEARVSWLREKAAALLAEAERLESSQLDGGDVRSG